jgi:hypothetical protein
MPVMLQERQIMAVGAENGWPFRVLGVAPVPERPVHLNDWWLVPLNQDTSTVPARALERVRALYAAGVQPKAFIIAHEAPKQLAPPKETPVVSPVEYWVKRGETSAVSALKVLGAVAAVAVPVVVGVLGLAAMAALSAATMVDPCLIAVTEDDVWIQIDWWMA